jgi:hypothetical protein
MTGEENANQGSKRLASILEAGKQPQTPEEKRPEPSQSPQEASGGQPGTPEAAQAMMKVQSSAVQPSQPQPASTRTRSQSADDSENVDPAGSETLDRVMGEGGGAGSTSTGDAKSFSRVAGEAAGRVTMLAGSAAVLNTALNGLTNRTIRVNESLAAYNGEIAVALGRARGREIERQIEQGQTIGPEYARLSEAQQEYRDTMTEIQAPLQSAAIDILATILEIRNGVLNTFAPALVEIAEWIEWIADKMPGGDNDNADVKQSARAFLSDVSDGKFDGLGTPYMNPGNRPLMSDADRNRIFGP